VAVTAQPARQSVADERNDLDPYDDTHTVICDKNGPPAVSARCEVCGQEFQARRSDAKLCSAKCRKRSSRRAAA
jgi:hypothetical protein